MTKRIRIIWRPGRGARFSFGRADYYGWRYMLSAGPLTICMGIAHSEFPA